MNKIILIFVFIVVFFIIVSGIVLLLSTYPPKFIIKAFNRNALYNVDKPYILHKPGMREDEAYEKFLETYRKAEEIITRTKK